MAENSVIEHHCDFTPHHAKSCARCEVVPGPFEKPLLFLHSKKAIKMAGTLTTTRRRDILPEDPVQKELVRKAIAGGQRGEKTHPVQRLGAQSLVSFNQSQARGHMPPPIGYPLSNLSNGAVVSSVPHVGNFGSFASWPKTSGSQPYYNASADQQLRAQHAYAAQGGYVVTAEARFTILPQGRTTPKLIGALLEVVDNVPAHIGAAALKTLCFNALYPEWVKYTNNFPLTMNCVCFRDEKWVALEPRNPDVDVIAHKVFHAPKKIGGAPQFRTKKLVLNLHVPNDIYDRFLAEKERAAEQDTFDHLVHISSSSGDHLVSLESCSKGRKRTYSKVEPSALFNSFSTTSNSTSLTSMQPSTSRPQTPPPSSKKIHLPVSPESPHLNRNELERVLKKQTHGTRLELNAICTNDIFQRPATGAQSAKAITLIMDTKQMTGAFKMAVLGESNPALFSADPANFDICVKQTFYVTNGLQIAGTTATPAYNIAHDHRYQAKLLSMEFKVPQMCFVYAGLASTGSEGQDNRDLFLVEEHIGTKEGKFRKYVHNGSAEPMVFNNAADTERAQFLSFTQHVQYFLTFKMVFVSDYQGGDTLLTDPQIMSSPDLASGRLIFADGNVSSGFKSFESDHRCNKFCHYFKLRNDYDQWVDDRSDHDRIQLDKDTESVAAEYVQTAGLSKAMVLGTTYH
ncbi:hypothetical protein C8R43DRAFT_1191365 [Mycena crocata]|nr:hypothetical protein C8R43DRAFT_1191365 [Mycena crocata]